MGKEVTMEKVVALAKNRGFIFPGSEIYGGLANTWDYGPLGARLKNNVKDTWRKRFIQERRNSYEVDADILIPRLVFILSTLALLLFGFVMVFSASNVEAINNGQSPFYFLIRQIFFGVVGIAIVLII